MNFDEQISMQLAKDRMEEALHAAEQRRAVGFGRAGVRVRLGNVLVRLGRWMSGQV